RLEHVRRQPVATRGARDLALALARRRHEDLDRPGESGPPALRALDRRAPEKHPAEHARLGPHREVVIPGAEFATGMDAALAAARRSLVPRAELPAADGLDRVVDRPEVAVEDAPQQSVL